MPKTIPDRKPGCSPTGFGEWGESAVPWMWSREPLWGLLTCKNVLVAGNTAGNAKPADSSDGFQQCYPLLSSKCFSIAAYRSPGPAGSPRQSGQRSWCLIEVPWYPFTGPKSFSLTAEEILPWYFLAQQCFNFRYGNHFYTLQWRMEFSACFLQISFPTWKTLRWSTAQCTEAHVPGKVHSQV